MFDLLRPALSKTGDALTFFAGCAIWAIAVLAAMILARHTWVVVAVAVASAVPMVTLPRWRRRRGQFAMLAVSLPAFLLVAEVAIRATYFGGDSLAHPARYQPVGAMEDPGYLAPAPEPGVIYTLRPGFEGWVKGAFIRANAAGLRDRDWPLERPHGVRRIITLGTSLTMGEGVPEDRAYPRALERVLRDRGATVEVLNFGVGGHTLTASQALLRGRAVRYQPDVVIQELGARALGETEESAAELRRSFERRHAAPSISFVERYSFAVTAVYPPISARKRIQGLFSGPATAVAAAPAARSYAEGLIGEFGRLARTYGFRGVLFVPRPMQSFGDRDFQRPERDRIRAIADAHDLLYVDSYDRFTAADAVDDLIAFPGDLHPNGDAHARHALALGAALQRFVRPGA